MNDQKNQGHSHSICHLHIKLRQKYRDYDFMEYDPEEEELSKTMSCIIEYIES